MKKSEDEDEDYKATEEKVPTEKKLKKKKKKQQWENVNKEFSKFSSGSDGTELEDERDTLFKSDHEFSCESEDEEDKIVVKLARTGAAKAVEKVEQFACKKCGQPDHPEWILLCDSCDVGWHASCLRPSLVVIPEGEWFCPDCNHKKLLSSLEDKLTEVDFLLKKTEAERRRKERLDFVNKSLSKALPSSPKKAQVVKKDKSPDLSSESSSSSEDSEDEPMLLRRCRTQNTVKYTTNEYDNMIKKALGEDIAPKKPAIAPEDISDEEESEDEDESEREESPGKAGKLAGQGKGKDIENCVSEEGSDNEEEGEKPKPVKFKANKAMDPKKAVKKKKKRLADLNASDDSGDGDSGSDFKLSGDDDDKNRSGSDFNPEDSEEED